MKLYEFEAKNILAQYGILVPKGELIINANHVREKLAGLKPRFAVKSQVLVAGRGKAGGVLFADSAEEAEKAAEQAAEEAEKAAAEKEPEVEWLFPRILVPLLAGQEASTH